MRQHLLPQLEDNLEFELTIFITSKTNYNVLVLILTTLMSR